MLTRFQVKMSPVFNGLQHQHVSTRVTTQKERERNEVKDCDVIILKGEHWRHLVTMRSLSCGWIADASME